LPKLKRRCKLALKLSMLKRTVLDRLNVRTLGVLGEKSANQGSVSQFPRPNIKHKAEENSRRIKRMAPPGGIS
jgi:hypothetical protein